MQRAIELALENVRSGRGGPFGAVIVKDGAGNRGRHESCHVHQRSHGARGNYCDPRSVPQAQNFSTGWLRTIFQLRTVSHVPGRDLLGAAGARVLWSFRGDAAAAQFDDAFIFREIAQPARLRIPMSQVMRDEALVAFRAWLDKQPIRIHLLQNNHFNQLDSVVRYS